MGGSKHCDVHRETTFLKNYFIITFITYIITAIMVSREEANAVVRTREDYWQAMVINDWYMPEVKYGMCSRAWMEAVRKGQF